MPCKLGLLLAKEVLAMATPPRPDPGALSIAPADGYQYGDDHLWTGTEQSELCRWLDSLADNEPDAPEAASR
jgi:hypothetical protein